MDKSTELECEQSIRLSSPKGMKSFPAKLRRIGHFDEETEKRQTFLTNNFSLPALKLAAIYKNRWKIELFFRWIKQNLRIKGVYGTSENAVYSQIWIAISSYLMVACFNKTYKTDESLGRILQILSMNVFQKNPCSRPPYDEMGEQAGSIV